MLKPILNKFTLSTLCRLICMMFTIGYVASAQAALGGDSASVETDRVSMRAEHAARQSLSATGSYTVYETTTPSGTIVRQYLSSNGLVFAVAWDGPFLPDFRQLLGVHFDTMVARQGKQSNAGHRKFNQQEGDLVIESGGHQRSFVGRAYLSSLIPVNVTLQDIQ